MDRKAHLKIDKAIFGKEYEQVHKWLDSSYQEFALSPIPHMHWVKYHHMQAIKDKYGNFTPEFNAAHTHIVCDFIYHFNMAYIPKDITDLIDTFIALGVIRKDFK